ncbi:MAG TPA: ABC transporter permease [Candidatus Angelobacter sp.]|nr:ABC transporter permease [Candidatus Angelobacter sp.]
MKLLRCWMLRVAGLFRKNRQDREFAAELESHLQMHTEDNLRNGMGPEQARREAMLQLGGLESTREAYRERGSVPWIEHLVQDVRFTLRQWRKSPGFAFTAVLILSLGICASVSIFGFVDAALIKPLPYQDTARLVGVFESIPLFSNSNLSYLDYVDWKKLNKSFTSLDVYSGRALLLKTPTGTEAPVSAVVSAGFFRTLGVKPILGRDFNPGEDSAGAAPVVMLSYAAWQKRYGGRSDVIGQTMTINGATTTIVGVLPRAFHFAPVDSAELWKTVDPTGQCESRRSCHSLFGVARLKDGVTLHAALADVTLIAKQLESQYPDSNRGQGADVSPLTDVIVGDVRPILLVLLGGSGLLLLIACVNVVSLLLVRSEGRKREIAVRSALGASAARLARQFLAEGLVMAGMGGLLGIAAAHWAMRLLTMLIPEGMLSGMPYLQDLGLNARVISAAGIIALLAAGLFCAIPAWRSASDLREGMAEGGRASAGTAWRRLGSRLVVVELTTAVVLLAGAGLLGRSLYRLLHVDLGIVPEHLAITNIAAPMTKYKTDELTVALGRRVTERIASLPGVQAASIASMGIPLGGNGNTTWVRFVGRPFNGEHNEVPFREVSSGYFNTLHAKLLRGRYFTDAEDSTKPPVTVVNQAFAKRYFPGEDPIGKRYGNIQLEPKSITEIVGVVEDIREGPLDQEIVPAIYTPFNQNPEQYFTVVARTSQAEQTVLPALAEAIHGIDSELVTGYQTTMMDRIRQSPSAYMHRTSAWLVGGFAALALLLGVVGLYGVIAYSVGQRTREIGVRMALGAERRSVYQMILKEAGRLIAIGVLAGLVCSVAVAQLMSKLLFGIRSWDAPTLLAVAGLLALAALLASYVPARRAASINPMEALRTE